jgi:hypothetical protein
LPLSLLLLLSVSLLLLLLSSLSPVFFCAFGANGGEACGAAREEQLSVVDVFTQIFETSTHTKSLLPVL